MAINARKSEGDREFDAILSTGASVTEEGQLLILVLENGTETVRPCTASDTAGVPKGWTKTDTVGRLTEVLFETAIVPSVSPYTVQLTNIDGNVTTEDDANGDAAIYDDTNSAWLAVGASASDGVFTITAAGLITFHSAQAGISVTTRYRVNMLARTRDHKYQQRAINSNVQASMRQVGVFAGAGRMYTDQYDVSVADWSTGTLRFGAGGRITTAGSGAALTTWMHVVEVPTADQPMLGLAFNLPG